MITRRFYFAQAKEGAGPAPRPDGPGAVPKPVKGDGAIPKPMKNPPGACTSHKVPKLPKIK